MISRLSPLVLSLLTLLCFSVRTAEATPPRFVIGEESFLLDGKPLQIRCGEIHAPRVPKEYWRHRLQLAKAMGLNTICAYLFWNLHEPREGVFEWTGQADAAAFCRIAQEEGLWVILRPGPYACAEWEMGGFPSWLLTKEGLQLRSREPQFISAAGRYLKEVGRVLAPLQVTRGGPILLVQVENEYGFLGEDSAYMETLRGLMLEAGFEVPLFACNPKDVLGKGHCPGLFPVVNFGQDPTTAFAALRKILPRGPLMCGEFYPGWFDTWGAPHHLGNTETYLKDLETMLRMGASFSIYMAHGGTSFGFTSGADRPFKPDTSSYDYDAPISEAGWVTPKFHATRALFSKYLLPGESLPEPPAANPVITIPEHTRFERASLLSALPPGIPDTRARPMEFYGQDYGCILYRLQLPAGPAALLEAESINDMGQFFLEGQRVGLSDRRLRTFKVEIPARTKASTLDILVEAMGRVNFGKEVRDHKGIVGALSLDGTPVQGVEVFPLPLDARYLAGLQFGSSEGSGPAFYRFQVEVPRAGDCFLDMRGWGKGLAWVNGHNLGRYWNIGPQQTMYVPGVWLHPGRNEFVILDLMGPERPVLAALDKPILDQLRPGLDLARRGLKPRALRVDSATPVISAVLEPGSHLQTLRFPENTRGRYVAIECLSTHDASGVMAIAELGLLRPDGRALSAAAWSLASVSSEQTSQLDGSALNAIDGQTANFWLSQGNSKSQWLVMDLGSTETLKALCYTPRQGDDSTQGRLREVKIYVGDALVERD